MMEFTFGSSFTFFKQEFNSLCLGVAVGVWSVESALYLGVIARIEFFSDWDNVLFEEFEPLLLKADLVHVDVHSWDVFITAGQTLVLNTNTQKRQKLHTLSPSVSRADRQSDRLTGYLV